MKKQIAVLMLLMFFLASSSCGNNGGNTAAWSFAMVSAGLTDQKCTQYGAGNILYLGDSNTRGMPASITSNYINCGIGGADSQYVLNFSKEIVSQYDPQAIHIMIGTNDYFTVDYANNLTEIINFWKNQNKVIYVQSILPTAGSEDRYIAENNVAQQENVQFINSRPAFEDINGSFDTQYTDDGLHLNAAGYNVFKKYLP